MASDMGGFIIARRYTTPRGMSFPAKSDNVSTGIGFGFPGSTQDVYFDTVSLLLHGNGVAGSTSFVDSSPNKLTAIANGGVVITTANSIFGGSSMFFDGVSSYISFPSMSAFGFGLGDFTIEAYIYISGGQGTDRGITDFRPIFSTDTGTFFIDGPTNKLAFWYGSKLGATGTALSTSTWYHVALSRNAGVLRCFLGGFLDWSSSAAVDFSSARPLGIGGSVATNLNPLGSSPFNGYIADLRITKGRGRYSANFVPPAKALPDF